MSLSNFNYQEDLALENAEDWFSLDTIYDHLRTSMRMAAATFHTARGSARVGIETHMKNEQSAGNGIPTETNSIATSDAEKPRRKVVAAKSRNHQVSAAPATEATTRPEAQADARRGTSVRAYFCHCWHRPTDERSLLHPR